MARYDAIGVDYAQLRKADPRIAAIIDEALGQAQTVLNVGAGVGSYEPLDRRVTAVEPSIAMIRQRRASTATVIQGHAENLAFDDQSFDASMAILTVHHWADKAKGLAEMRRVTRGPIVILTCDPDFRGFWLTDYIPQLITLDAAQMPKISDYERWLGPISVTPVIIPYNCTDGFLCAYWRRPAAYLDSKVRAAISPFSFLGDVTPALDRLRTDLDSGAWHRRYAHLQAHDGLDCGYRLIVARGLD